MAEMVWTKVAEEEAVRQEEKRRNSKIVSDVAPVTSPISCKGFSWGRLPSPSGCFETTCHEQEVNKTEKPRDTAHLYNAYLSITRKASFTKSPAPCSLILQCGP